MQFEQTLQTKYTSYHNLDITLTHHVHTLRVNTDHMHSVCISCTHATCTY